jgi:acyl-CoA dehydrogenase
MPFVFSRNICNTTKVQAEIIFGKKQSVAGPSNYLGNVYRGVPVSITVEGANILTRNLIIFGQGAIRCHPFLLDEMLALEQSDESIALDAFDRAFSAHVRHSAKTLLRAWLHSWTGGLFAAAPQVGDATPFFRQLSRYCAAFAITADVALVTLGGALKRREMLSARLGDVLSELYLLSAALKRWEDDGRKPADLPVLRWCMLEGYRAIERGLDEVLTNLPNRFAAACLRFIIVPRRNGGAPDHLTLEVGALLMAPSPTRERLTERVDRGANDDGLARLERAFDLVVETEPIRDRLRRGGVTDPQEGCDKGLITREQAERIQAAEEAVARVIAVDDFSPDAFARHQGARNPNDAQRVAE